MARIGSRGVNLEAGEVFTLEASSAHLVTAGANGTGVYIGGERQRYIIYLNVTAGQTAAGDKLDVYVDWSLDDVTYFNGGHFTQVLGNAAVKAFFMIFDPSAPTATDLDITADASVHTSRPALFGPYIRARWIIIEGTAASFTFSVKGYAI